MLKSVVITGAGTGIGKALSVALAKQGCSIIGIGRHLATLEATQKTHPDRIKIIQADLTKPEDRKQVVENILELNQHISLIHNAGTIEPLCLLSDIQLKDWKNTFELNVEAPLFLTQGLLPCLKGGRVLHISSGLAHYARSGMGVYCVTKAALYMLYQCCKKELDAYNICVGSVMPGVVDTPMQAVICETPLEHLPGVQDFISLKETQKLVSPEVVADFLKWLLLDTSDDEFTRDEWDISDRSHHKEWLKDPNSILNWTFS